MFKIHASTNHKTLSQISMETLSLVENLPRAQGPSLSSCSAPFLDIPSHVDFLVVNNSLHHFPQTALFTSIYAQASNRQKEILS
jgi:hypothetical protein